MFKKILLLTVVMIALAFSQDQYIKQNDAVRLSPRLLNYQGYLTDEQGIPITNPSVSMTFGIWSSSGGGSQLWYETQTVSIDRGVFSVLLGTNTPIPDSVFTISTDRWLELTVGGITLAPRTRIVSASYAYTATHSDTADYARLLQGKDTTALDSRYVNEGQVNSVFTVMINDTAVTMAKIAPTGAVTNQVIKWTGTAWQPGSDVVGADNDWIFLISDGADTTLQMGGRWGLTRLGNTMYGNADSTHVNLGVANTTGTSGQNYKYCTVTGGRLNTAGCTYATVGGGYSNAADSTYATISGGYNNTAGLHYAVVGGGYTNNASGYAAAINGGRNNYASDTCAFVGGGRNNKARGPYSVVSGGGGPSTADSNAAIGYYSFIGGGRRNIASNYNATVSGGFANVASNGYTTIGGGNQNTASGNLATVGGGFSNIASGEYSLVGGGNNNIASGYLSAVVSGNYNDASDTGAFVNGGRNNKARGIYSVVGGGGGATAVDSNAALGDYAVVSGGRRNIASSSSATVGGGGYNTASGSYSATVAGGLSNSASGSYATVAGGMSNSASGSYATVGGGRYDTTAGYYGFTTNYHTKVNASDTNSAAFTTSHTTAKNQVRAAAFSTGTLDFAMDHPDDPMNKILNQYAVGSDEVVSKYSGSAVLGADGRANVNLPDYFDDINRDPRIQLTGVGTYEIYVAEKISGGRFVIGGKPGTEVYWEVTAERTDIHAEIARIQTPVVQEKTGELRGHSIDDDAMIGMYDGLHQKNPELFILKTDEGRRVHEQAKQIDSRN